MEVYIEIVGNIKGQILDNYENTSRLYKIFRVYSKPRKNDEAMYFNCLTYEGEQAFAVLNNMNVQDGFSVLVRGRLLQKYTYEQGYEVVEGKKQFTKRLVCKNRVLVDRLTVLYTNQRTMGDYVSNTKFEKESKIVSGGKEIREVKADDNPFD